MTAGDFALAVLRAASVSHYRFWLGVAAGMLRADLSDDQSHDDCPTCGNPPPLQGAARYPDPGCPDCGGPLPTTPTRGPGPTKGEDDDIGF